MLAELFGPFCQRIEWMSVESAEMTKHALNAFLATSVTFINEVARLCEEVGADAKEVERGLKSEGRIGPRAYLSPGSAFAGGTLARDLRFLVQRGADVNIADKDGWTALMFAAKEGTLAAARAIIRSPKQSSLDALAKETSALSLAAERNRHALVRALTACGKNDVLAHH